MTDFPMRKCKFCGKSLRKTYPLLICLACRIETVEEFKQRPLPRLKLTEEKILEALANHNPSHTFEIEAEKHIATGSFHTSVLKLMREGLVCRMKRGYYALTEKGSLVAKCQ